MITQPRPLNDQAIVPPTPISAPERLSFSARTVALVRAYPLPTFALFFLLIACGLWGAHRSDLAQWPLAIIVVVGGVPLLWRMINDMRHGHFGIDLIAIMAIIGAFALREYLAGSFIVLMLAGGEALEGYATRRARASLAALAERAPRSAHIWRDGQLVDVAADAVAIDQVVVVKPGEIIPVDGIVTSGNADINEADLTGEPVPIAKGPGELVVSGGICLDGVIEVRALKRSADSQYALIIAMVQQAQDQKAPIHRLADRYSVGFTVVTVLVASLTWMISGDSIYALAVLVVATPCPLILATPIAIMSGMNTAARRGIILKSGGAMELLGEVDVAVFDKTGTLTLGTPTVTALIPTASSGLDEARLLRLAVSVEQFSAHILARAVVSAAHARGESAWATRDFHEVFGKGASAIVTGNGVEQRIAIGNGTFLRQLAIEPPEDIAREREERVMSGEIVSYIAADEAVVGLIVMADVPRPELRQLVPALKTAGIRETVLLTGDNAHVAQRVGALAGVDRVIARCLPEDKVRVVREYESSGHRVLMVGDGVNDAPALAAATLGLAIGIQGVTAAASAADAVLVAPDVLRVASAVRSGRWVLRVAIQGIWIGMGLSGVAMLVAAFGYLPPAAGAILQEGIDVLVILNALRAGQR